MVEGHVSGAHRSPFHGVSAEFAQHREYTPGDDLRYVDWKIFGRTDRFYVKQFQEETNLPCYLLVDTSRSMTYRSANVRYSKLDFALRVAAALAYLVLRQHDAVGLVCFAETVGPAVPPSNAGGHLRSVLETFERVQPAGATAMRSVLDEVAARLKRRSVLLILSDCFDEVEPLFRGLKHLRHRRHDVSVLQIIDPAERDFPFQDHIEFRDLESSLRITTDAQRIRKTYHEVFAHEQRRLVRGLRDLAVDHHLVTTDVAPEAAVVGFLQRRAG
ncbi:MAG: DUF58 domain-containing protein [Planctomycetota bacterium]|nr:MAG: DUF58 domain-containing protein [Planctomycetota bacterium]